MKFASLKKDWIKKRDPSEFPAKVPRPKYSVPENKRLKLLGTDIMPHWEDSLKNYLKNYEY
jgi:dTDP-4-dehydrorhamnose reductase